MPGSGKTTLAARLAGALGLPHLSRDAMSEDLAGVLGADTLADSERNNRAALAVFLGVGVRLLRSGTGLVMDHAFRHGLAEADLAPLVRASRACLVHCHVPPAEALERYAARFERGERHACHHDAERLARVRGGARTVDLAWYEPLDLGIPTLPVDTRSGYAPAFDAIVAFVRSSADAAAIGGQPPGGAPAPEL
jgi:predicted kinase